MHFVGPILPKQRWELPAGTTGKEACGTISVYLLQLKMWGFGADVAASSTATIEPGEAG